MRMAGKFLVAAALVAASATSALATDLYVAPADPVMAAEPDTDWSGLYVGVYGEWTRVNIGPGINLPGFGVRVGGNVDSGNIVWGIEGAAEYQWTGPSTDVQVVGRLGVGAGDALIFATGGAGWISAPVATNYWTVGAGAEFMVSEQFSLRADYKFKMIPGGGPTSHNLSAGASFYFN